MEEVEQVEVQSNIFFYLLAIKYNILYFTFAPNSIVPVYIYFNLIIIIYLWVYRLIYVFIVVV